MCICVAAYFLKKSRPKVSNTALKHLASLLCFRSLINYSFCSTRYPILIYHCTSSSLACLQHMQCKRNTRFILIQKLKKFQRERRHLHTEYLSCRISWQTRKKMQSTAKIQNISRQVARTPIYAGLRSQSLNNLQMVYSLQSMVMITCPFWI